MSLQQIIEWLLEGDVSIQYQTKRDLLGFDDKVIQSKISYEGWGKQFLSKRKSNKHWGLKFYQPKWISSHYTLLDLRNLNLSPENTLVKETIDLILNTLKASDGGIQLGPSTANHSDVCVNGMFLNYASYFKSNEKDLCTIVDSLISQIMPDGGFNCRSNRSGAIHSSLHSTISVIEGITEFIRNGYTYRQKELEKIKQSSIEFILQHQFYISDRTGHIINKEFLKFPYPSRWKYNILRALDYFQYERIEWDNRMNSAINILMKKRNKDGTWKLNAKHSGQQHFEMEKAGKPSRWNTLRALRILKHYNQLQF